MSNAVCPAHHLTVEEDATQKLTRIWEQLLNVRPIEPDQNYFDLGGDSLLAVQMFAEIEQVFGVQMPMATLFDAPTINDLARTLVREVPTSGWSSLVVIQPNGSRPPFFCMHGAGGGVLIYRELSQRLGDDQPFYGLQSQGLDGNTEVLTSIEDMATNYVREIRKVQPRGPYYLGGYCSGGTIAYEVAQQLVAKGETVALVAMFDTFNWCKVPLLTPGWKVTMAVEKVIFHVLNFARLGGGGKREFLRAKMHILRNRIPVWRGILLRKLAGGAEDARESKPALVAKVWLTNDQAATNYNPKPYRGTVTDFRPLQRYSIHKRPDLKWENLALGGQKVVQLPVYPAGMIVEPFVGALAEALKKSIDSALKPESTRA